MSAGHRHGNEKAASALADSYYDRAKVLIDACTVNRSYQCPWLANRTRDCKTVFVDDSVPVTLKCGVNTDLSLPWHEIPECLAMDDGLPYDEGTPSAHVDVATPLERREVERQFPDDPDIWSKYSDEMDGYIKEVDDETITHVPPEMDTRVFTDDHEKKIIDELIAAGGDKAAHIVRACMPQILKPSDVAQRLAAGEEVDAIFIDAAGGYKAKLLGPEAAVSVGTEADRSVDFVISSEAVDRYTDIISLGGWKTQNYVRNPVVLWAHDDSIPAIARGSNIRIEDKALRSTAIFAEKEFHPLADTIYNLIKGKFISAASVGFVPLKAKAAAGKDRPYGIDILEQELLEWSVVNIPANPECLVNARSVGIDCAPLIGWAERVLDKGGMLLIPRDELEALRKAAGAATQYQVKTPAAPAKPAKKVKSLWHVAWLADILMDVDSLQDCVQWEAEYEGDGSPVPQKIADALKALGQILVDMTVEEVNELLAGKDEDDMAPAVFANAAPARMRILRLLPRADVKVLSAVVEALTPPKTGGLVDLVAATAAIAASLTKGGKVLSAENEKKLKTAHEHVRTAMDHCQAACDHVAGVVAANDPNFDEGDEDSDANASGAAAAARRAREADALKLKHQLTVIEAA